MREQYTFSRALHLMRNGGAFMRHIAYSDGIYLFYDKFFDCVMLQFPSGNAAVAILDGTELAGSFTRYVPELDGVK